MTVFELQTHRTRYSNFALLNSDDEVIYRAFDGTPLARNWRALPIGSAEEDSADAEFADYALLGVIPVFSLRAMEELLDLLKPNGELLPLRYPDGEYFAYNVTRVVDALDEHASTVLRFTSGGIMTIQRYVFDPMRLGTAPIFKLRQLPKAFVYVTDEFVRRVEDSGLTGFHFRALWSGELNRQNLSAGRPEA